MARNGADVLVKKHNKLEAFLKRQLDADTFERIRAHDSCIVCSEKEQKVFKFVVLSDKWIYLTENPPKKVQEAVHFKDVVSVDLVHQYPEFLAGNERKNCQHIVIKYLTKEPAKGKRRRNSKDKTQDSITPRKGSNGQIPRSGTETSRSSPLPSTRNSSREEKRVQFQRGSTSSLGSGGSGDIDTETGAVKQKGKKKKSISSRGSTSSLDESLLTQATSDVAGSKKKKTHKSQRHPSFTSNLATTLRNQYSSSEFDKVRCLPRPLPNPTEDFDENGEFIDKRTKEPLKFGYNDSGELKLNLELLDDDDDDDSGDDVDDLEVKKTMKNGKGNRLQVPGSGRSSSVNKDNLDSLRDEDVFEDDELEMGEAGREAELHLYILHLSSPMLMLTRSAWNNYLIRGTLDPDAELESAYIPITPRKPGVRKPQANEALDRLYSGLKTELLAPENTIEDTFTLIAELKAATEKNFSLKKLFWKTSDVFTFMVKQLQKYLPKSPRMSDYDSERSKKTRADEFELIILIIETLSVLFRETEILPSRVQCLKAGGGKAALDLIVVLTCFPVIPQRYIPPSTKAAALLNSAQMDQWKCTADAELCKLMQEFTNKSTSLLFELVLIAHQANWGDSEGEFFNICWMIKILEELNTTEKYVERVIAQAMKLICPSKREELLPHEAILVFQQFSVLQTLVEYSPQTAAYIRNNFYEEFKYYIQAPVIVKKLPKSYPIASYAIRLMEEVMGVILQKKVKIAGN